MRKNNLLFLAALLFLNLAGYHSELLYSQNKKQMTFDEVLEYNYYSVTTKYNCDTAMQLLPLAVLSDSYVPALNDKLNLITNDFTKLAVFLQDHYTDDLPFNAYLEYTCETLTELSNRLELYADIIRVKKIVFTLLDCSANWLLCAAQYVLSKYR